MARSTRTYRGVPAEQRRAERRTRLLDAALERFTADGYHASRIERICTDAGVSTRNFYEEFPTKQALLLTLHDRINAAALDRVAGALEQLTDEDVPSRISTLLDAFMGSVTADPRLPRLNYVEAVGVSPELERQHQEWVARWAALIEDEAAHAASVGHAPERDYRLISIALVGVVTGLLREWQAHEALRPVEEITDAIRHVMVAAITSP